MAEIVLQSVVDTAIERLASMISQEIGQACGVKEELVKLQMSVSAIRAVLRDAERAEATNQLKDWLRKLEDVVYDADDLLDDFSTETLHRRLMKGNRAVKEVRIFFSSSNQLAYRVKMANQIRAIRERMDAISKDKVDFHMNINVGNIPTLVSKIIASRMTIDGVSFVHESNVIGRDKDKEEIIAFLLNSSSLDQEDQEMNVNVSILPIVGVGGLGKTTLAKLVFNETSVQEHFHLKVWVCVSIDFDIVLIVKNILEECNIPTKDKDGKDLSMNKLQEKLRGVINERKYLIVLDDVWNENRTQWSHLEQLLTSGARGSKILVTTRSQKVAKVTAITQPPHLLEGLGEDEGLGLLMQMAHKQEGEWKGKGLENIGREIVRKCVGVPLAIKTIGRLLLSSENTEREWLSFRDNDLWRIDQEVGDIMPTLKLSYDYLPWHLKPCLAYCSLFPKDFSLDPQDLVYLWMSQGFITQETKRSPEEVGREYFMELVWRSFFQDFEHQGNRIIKCKMHDLVHDLTQIVAMDYCVSIDESNDERGVRVGLIARHASTILKLDQVKGTGIIRLEKLRTLIHLGPFGARRGDMKEVISSLTNIRALRVYDMVPIAIGKLKHLRFLELDLPYVGVEFLPNSISKLHNLEILIVRGNSWLIELPRGFTNLVKLRKLDIRGCKKLHYLPCGIGKMPCLQLVLGDGIVVENSVGGNKRAAGLEELAKLKGLGRKELQVRNLGPIRMRELVNLDAQQEEEMCVFFKETCSTFESVKFEWEDESSPCSSNVATTFEKLEVSPSFKGFLSIEGYLGDKLPCWIAVLNNLSRLDIRGCSNCKILPPVHQLPLLKELYINYGGFQFSEVGAETESFFPSLKELVLREMRDFKGWKMLKNDVEVTLIPVFNRNGMRSGTCGISSYDTHISYMYGNYLWLMYLDNTTLLQVAADLPPPCMEMEMEESIHSDSNMLLPISSIPFHKVEELTIGRTIDVQTFPSTFFFKPSRLHLIRVLKFVECVGLKSLPIITILQNLNTLEELFISKCPDLDLCSARVVNEEEEEEEDPSTATTSIFSSSNLQSLRIEVLRKLKILPWWIQHLPRLTYLYIGHCKNLKTLEFSISGCLDLDLCSARVVNEEEEDPAAATTSTISSSNLQLSCSLECLRIESLPKLKILPWWIQHLHRLKSLYIRECDNLKTLPERLPKLNSLQDIYISYCDTLEKWCRKEAWSRPRISYASLNR